MTFGARGGSFGTPGRGPFRAGGGGLSGAYNLGQSAQDTASLDKYVAQTAWSNGQLSDAGYVAALEKYLGTTSEGSRERVSAQNELDETQYTIGRNKITTAINDATNPSRKIGALTDLIAYDNQHLKGMAAKDSQAYRDAQQRILDAQGEIRNTRYSALVDLYNEGQRSTDALLAMAQRNARESKGQPDSLQWQQSIIKLNQTKADEAFNAVYQDYQMNRVSGAAVLTAMDKRLALVSPSSPQYQQIASQREDLVKSIANTEQAKQDSAMEERRQMGTVSDEQYLRYLMGNISRAADGTPEQQAAKDKFIQQSFSVAEDRLKSTMDTDPGSRDQLIGLYTSRIATLNPNSALALALQQNIVQLQMSANQGTSLFGPTGSFYVPQGRWLTPGGTPTNDVGFASQFDGSAFGSQNCLMAASAMLAWAVTNGKKSVSGGDMRYYSGDGSGGTNPPDAVTALHALGLKANDQHVSLDQMIRLLAGGTPMAITGNYGNVPAQFRISGFQGLHGMFAQTAKKKDGKWWIYIKDPQGRAGYDGQWWPAEVMNAFAYAPNSTNGWVVTAGKGTKANLTPGVQDNSVPFQAFDTDAQGRSTIGRGGGTSRDEAGAPQDWSSGKPTVQTTPSTGTDSASVSKFLAAVSSVEKTGSVPSAWTDEEKFQRATMLLQEFNGDARLAGIAWFLGDANPDSGKWNQQDLYYANAVGTSLGYARIPAQGIGVLDTTSPAPSVGASPGNGPEATLPLTTQGTLPTGPSSEVAQQVLTQIGAPVTPDMVRAMQAWLATENGVDPSKGGGTVRFNNPFNLKGQSPNVYPGITGIEDDGTLHFATVADATRAVALELRTDFPSVVASATAGNPESFLRALDSSGWTPSGYQGQLFQSYNELPGATGISGTKLLNTPSDMESLARTYPDVGELFAIDPRDPAQKFWFDTNVKSMQQAANTPGATTWDFTMRSGKVIALPFDSNYYVDMLASNLGYAKAQEPVGGTPDQKAQWSRDVLTPAATLYANNASSAWQDANTSLDAAAQHALERGDLTGYANIRMQQKFVTENILGLAHDAPPGTPPTNPNGLSGDQIRAMMGKLGEWSPRIVDQQNPSFNATGDPILGLLYQNPKDSSRSTTPDGLTVFSNATLQPTEGFITQNPDGTSKLITMYDQPDLFHTVPMLQPDGTVQDVPAYSHTDPNTGMAKYTNVTIAGASVWLPQETVTVPVYFHDAAGYRTDGHGGTVVPTEGQIRPGAEVQVPAAVQVDPATGLRTYHLLLGGTGQSLIWTNDPTQGATQPILVLNTGAQAQIKNDPTTGQAGLYIGSGNDAKPYTPEMYNLLGSFVHWYGTDTTDPVTKPGAVGAPGVRMAQHIGTPNALGGTTYDAGLTNDELWMTGAITAGQYAYLQRAEAAAIIGFQNATSYNVYPIGGEPKVKPWANYLPTQTVGVGPLTAQAPLNPNAVMTSPGTVTLNAPVRSVAGIPQFPSTMPGVATRALTFAEASRNATALAVAASQQAAAQRLAVAQARYNAQHQIAQPTPVPVVDTYRNAPKPVVTPDTYRNAPKPVTPTPVPSGPSKRPGGGGVYVE